MDVSGMTLEGFFLADYERMRERIAELEGEQAPTALDSFFHHYHEPTVEDVLCELLNEYREGGCALEETRLSDYADKLCMVDENE